MKIRISAEDCPKFRGLAEKGIAKFDERETYRKQQQTIDKAAERWWHFLIYKDLSLADELEYLRQKDNYTFCRKFLLLTDIILTKNQGVTLDADEMIMLLRWM